MGGLNTIVTYAVFVGLGLLIPVATAFTIAFLLGLVWVVFGSSRYVFRAHPSAASLLLFAALYLGLYVIGRVVIHAIDPIGIRDLALASLAVMAVTTPLAFIGGRYLFSGEPTRRNSDREEELTT